MRLFLFLCIFQYFCFVCPDYCNLNLGKGGAHSKKPHVFQMSLLARNNEGSKNSHIYIYQRNAMFVKNFYALHFMLEE